MDPVSGLLSNKLAYGGALLSGGVSPWWPHLPLSEVCCYIESMIRCFYRRYRNLISKEMGLILSSR